MKLTIEVEVTDTDLPKISAALLALGKFSSHGFGETVELVSGEIAETIDTAADTTEADAKAADEKKKKAAAARKKKAAEKKAADAKATEPKSTEASDLDAMFETSEDGDAGEIPSMDELQEALQAFISKNSVAKAKAVMAEYGVEKFTDLPEDDWASFMTKLKAGTPE